MAFKPFPLTPKSILRNIKRGILDEIVNKIDNINGAEEIYFHDIISKILDRNTPKNMKLCHAITDDFMTDEDYLHIDESMINTSSIQKTAITSAYVALENELFKDDFFQDFLQNKLNNEVITKGEGFKILDEIADYIKEHNLKPETFEDNETQIHITIGEKLELADFQEPYFNKSQVINLGDDIKILANNYETNKNAIVMELISHAKSQYHYRVYIMDKSKGLDIRKLLVKFGKEKTIGSHNGWNLDPRNYIDAPSKEYPIKKEFIYTINQLVNGENGLIVMGEKEHENK